MTKKKLARQALIDFSLDSERSGGSVIRELTSPDLPRDMARLWLSRLSLEELEQEKAWLESLIASRKQEAISG